MCHQDWVQHFIESEKLPPSFAAVANDYFIPFAQQLVKSVELSRTQGVTFVIAVNGAQGTGKTTFAKFLSSYFRGFHELNGANISLDDFYLTRAERRQRADEIHPLFLTRGVPGTHDTSLAHSTINSLKNLETDETLALPSFDKANDDRKAKQDWPAAKGIQDFIIFEGWCVGSQPVSAKELDEPINSLEENEDPQALWRRAVNKYLREDYQQLFALHDVLIFLKAPDFEAILNWRGEQEQKLRHKTPDRDTYIIASDDIRGFVQHFERITRGNLINLPKHANHIFEFDREHQITSRIDKKP